MSGDVELREKVRERYAAAATSGSCCGPECCTTDPSLDVDLTAGTYSRVELDRIPVGAAEASLGCGNPTAVADLHPGETVLDLGSGGGIDVLLSARRVGETGFVYGLDMTEEMLDLARANASEAGVMPARRAENPSRRKVFARSLQSGSPLRSLEFRCAFLRAREIVREQQLSRVRRSAQ